MSGTIASETELIQTYLAPLAAGMPGSLGLRDDAAFITPPAGTDLVITTDPVIAGVHFFADQRADDIAWKALAVNVSDIAAKGAVPLGYTMALAFPNIPNRDFMEQFASGLAAAQQQFGCALVGGDTDKTPGPLSVSITLFGAVPAGRMVRRNTAGIGDHVFVTGTLGDAALGLRLYSKEERATATLTSGAAGFLVARYLRPSPRLELAPLLREHASAALDISDGFIKDLRRLLTGARGGIDLPFEALPLSPPAKMMLNADFKCSDDVLCGGDDYEILFSVPHERVEAFLADASAMPFSISEVGRIIKAPGLAVRNSHGDPMSLGSGGWDHFS